MSKVEVNETCAAKLCHPWLAWTECVHAACETPDRQTKELTLKSLPLLFTPSRDKHSVYEGRGKGDTPAEVNLSGD